MTAIRRNRVLGAILAGGASRRFGSDKALADIDGKPMLDHVIDVLSPQVDAILMCGRSWRDYDHVEDDPPGRLGPLAGLNAALGQAKRRGFGAVLSLPVDVLPVPSDLLERLGGDSPAVLTRQFLIGYWPVTLGDDLAAFVRTEDRVMRWIEHCNARMLPEPEGLANINRAQDLSDLG